MEKKTYNAPQIELILLDNEISLALASTPPAGPSEMVFISNQHFTNEPFKGSELVW